jgi:DNA-binding response OmpR family regulator
MNIWIVDDDLTMAIYLASLLRHWNLEQYEMIHDGREALERLETDDPPHIMLLDWTMPEVSGIEVCRRLRHLQEGSDHYTYTMMLTARSRRPDMIEGLEAGVDDFMVKPFESYELKLRLDIARRIVSLNAQLNDSNRRLRQMAARSAKTPLSS